MSPPSGKIPAQPGSWFWLGFPLAIVAMVVLALLGVELVWIAVAVIVIVVGGLAFSVLVPVLRQPRKNAEVRAWAERRGWEYRPWAPREALRGFGIFRKGFVSAAVNLVIGSHRGWRVKAFSFRTTTGGGRSSTPYRYQVVAVGLPGRVPMIEIRPQPVWRRLLRLPGGSATGHRGFDTRFRVESRDPSFARSVLGPGVAEWLAEDPRAGSIPVRFSDDELVTWRRGWLSPDRALGAADFLIDLLERIPAEVLRQGR